MRLLLLLLLLVALAVLISRMRSQGSPQSAPVDQTPQIGSLEADVQTLSAMKQAGADLTKPTEVTYFLYFPTRERAEQAAGSANTGPLAANVRPAATGNTWLCEVRGVMVPSESAIHAASTRLAALATSLGGEYDGWEAEVVK